VVPKGQPYTTALQAADKAKAQRDAAVNLAEPVRDVALNLYHLSTKREDGSTLWTVPVGPRVGTETGFIEVAEFLPQDLKIKAGDTVRWYFFSPHTVTFMPPGETALPAVQPPATPSGQPYDGRSLVNSGTLAFTAADGLRYFEMKFPNAGTFPYLCFLHYTAEGQKGVVTVQP
jgi:plastocyanin